MCQIIAFVAAIFSIMAFKLPIVRMRTLNDDLTSFLLLFSFSKARGLLFQDVMLVCLGV